MRYRTLDANGDYSFGQGQANFLINSPATVAQAVQTRLFLIAGEWFLDTSTGVPYSTEILGYGTEATRDIAIQEIILETQGVTEITDYASAMNRVTRKFSVAATINTQYGPTTITATL
jgi:hypothetical protein